MDPGLTDATASDDLRTLLDEQAEPGWALEITSDRASVTADTRTTYSNTADAMAAAEELLAAALDLGYRLRRGTVGAWMPEQNEGEGEWRGRLVEVLLAAEPA